MFLIFSEILIIIADSDQANLASSQKYIKNEEPETDLNNSNIYFSLDGYF